MLQDQILGRFPVLFTPLGPSQRLPPAPPPRSAPRALEACQSLWELSPEQQRLVISNDLVVSGDGHAYDALMDRISALVAAGEAAGLEASKKAPAGAARLRRRVRRGCGG